MNSWREIGSKGKKLEKDWNNILDKKNSKIKEEYERLIKGELPSELDKILGTYENDQIYEDANQATIGGFN